MVEIERQIYEERFTNLTSGVLEILKTEVWRFAPARLSNSLQDVATGTP